MALEEDQIEQAMSLNHDAYPTRRALWMDERRRPIGARVRVGRNCRSSCCRNHPLSFFLSLAGGGRRCPARQPAPTAKQGQDASDAHYRWCAGDDGARRAGADRDRDKPRVEPAVRCCVPCEPPCLAAPVLLAVSDPAAIGRRIGRRRPFSRRRSDLRLPHASRFSVRSLFFSPS